MAFEKMKSAWSKQGRGNKIGLVCDGQIVVAGKAIWEHKLEGGDRVSHVAIWGESIPSRKTSEHKDTGMRMWFAQSMGRGAGKGITNHAGLYS